MRNLAAVALSLILAGSAVAQTAEYGHDSATVTLDMTTKHAKSLYGSFLMTSARDFGLTGSGALVKDRVWFFASANRSSELFRTAAVPATVTIPGYVPQTSLTLPKDFLTLKSTTILSPGASITVNVSGAGHF